MFQSSKARLRTWMQLVDDILADHPDDVRDDEPGYLHHPHRTPLRRQRERRLGSVPARPAHCISPVRTASERPRPDRAAR
jgi:hypothetical protein